MKLQLVEPVAFVQPVQEPSAVVLLVGTDGIEPVVHAHHTAFVPDLSSAPPFTVTEVAFCHAVRSGDITVIAGGVVSRRMLRLIV